MTTPSSTISANNVNTELLAGGNTTLTFNETRVRALAQRPTNASQISMLDLRSKNRIHYLSSPVQNLNVYTRLVTDGWDRVTPITYVINSGVYVWSDNTALPALDTGGPFPSGLTLINNGYIIGKGGDGGTTGTSVFPSPTGRGRNGGNALSVNSSGIGFTNNGYVAAGGGGGGSGGTQDPFGGSFSGAGGGGGAGGGNGATAIASNPYFVPAAGGAGGAIGQSGANGTSNGRLSFHGGGGGGGRILPGVGGAGRGPVRGGGGTYGGGGGGAGGGGGVSETGTSPRVSGAGGSANGAGGNGSAPGPSRSGTLYSYGGAGGGGGWGATGGTGYYYNAYAPTGGFLNFPGGTGGKAIALNGYTFPVGGTGITYGAIS